MGDRVIRTKPVVGVETFAFIIVFFGLFVVLGMQMGTINMLNTMMNTAFDLLLNTVFYIMAIAVLAGAISALFTEFGLVALVNMILSPLMKPLYGLPGAASLGIVTTYLSDNPAILSLASDKGFKKFFKKYQMPALCNLGTSFGMGLIVTTYMMSIKSPSGENLVTAALIGDLGAVIGSIVSTRIMLHYTKKMYGTEEWMMPELVSDKAEKVKTREISEGSVAGRVMNCLLSGGKTGVDVGLAIIPGVLIICTIVMMLTNGASADGSFTGAAYEGVAVLPFIGEKIDFILKPFFGFTSASCISVPITALGAAGAAMGLVPSMVRNGLAGANDIAVFTAMCMCWSGYLSTHIAMMDSLRFREATGKAILAHTIGGLCAGVSAHWIYTLITMF